MAVHEPTRSGTHAISDCGTTEQPAYSVTLPRVAESAHDARDLASSALGFWGLGEIEESAWLVVTELVSNAVTHARRDNVRVTVTRKGLLVVRFTVTDFSKALPRLREADGDDEQGRGLAIVDAVTGGQWGADLLNWGKSVWADLTAPGKVEA
jgi:anti-sigma regulatory factor (Ser/Thr protein kinase)